MEFCAEIAGAGRAWCCCGFRRVAPDLRQQIREQRLPFSPVLWLGKGSLAPGDISHPDSSSLEELCCQTEESLFFSLPFPAQEGRCKPAPSALLMCELSTEGKTYKHLSCSSAFAAEMLGLRDSVLMLSHSVCVWDTWGWNYCGCK